MNVDGTFFAIHDGCIGIFLHGADAGGLHHDLGGFRVVHHISRHDGVGGGFGSLRHIIVVGSRECEQLVAFVDFVGKIVA